MVWQEDEMPEELKSSPGYVPFTLGIDAQAWVDSMAEVVDGGNGVYGRPKPAVPTTHRSLTTPPPPQVAPPSPAPPRPDVSGPPRTIRGVPETRPLEMPEIGGPEQSPPHRPPSGMPEIGGPESAPPSHRAPDMPEIASTRQRTLPKRVVMPEIGDEQSRPPLIPEIGE